MPSDLPEQLEQIFHDAMQLPAEARAAFLDRACPNADTRDCVERLLAAALKAHRNPAWKGSALDAATAAEIVPDSLDRYRLLDPIGSGGMGIVYKAVRDDGVFSKTVAIKIVHAVDPDGAIVRHFLRERQILAVLDHPNIVRLLDGGATHEGLPFLVMEYVEGLPLSRYLAEAKPGVPEILRLFRRICAAVAYAHSNLIVHRDLKPGNILVTADGEPHLLDFGIAQLLDNAATRTGSSAMTAEYASPEQVLGTPVTTASDIYSLGVVLFEMLTGTRPYRVSTDRASTSPIDMFRAITTDEPLALNDAGRTFDSDLETIIGMALRKEPNRRYASVAQFSDDLERYLAGYPVSARPDTPGYRVRKFVRRNRLAVTGTALLSIAIGAGVASTIRQERIATRRFNEVRGMAHSYLFEVREAIKDLPGSTAAQRLVVKRASEYLDKLAAERGNDVQLSLELAAAYRQTAVILGQPYIASLGDVPGAIVSCRKAVNMLEGLAPAHQRDVPLLHELADDTSFLGWLLTNNGDLKAAAPWVRESVALSEKLVATQPADVKLRDSLSLAYVSLGDLTGNPSYPNLGNPAAALDIYRKAVALRLRLLAEDPGNIEKERTLATVYSRMAQVLPAVGDKVAAVEAYTQATQLSEKHYATAPLNAASQWEAAVSNRNLSLALLSADRVADARIHGDRAFSIFEKYAKADAKNVAARNALADATYSQAWIRFRAGVFAESRTLFAAALAEYNALKRERPGALPPSGERAAYQQLTELNLKTGKAAQAIDTAGKELEIDKAYLAVNSANSSAIHNQAVASRQLGQAHALLATAPERREAAVWYQRAMEIYLSQKSKGTFPPAWEGELTELRGYMETLSR